MTKTLSGPDWCSKYPTSKLLTDLLPAFHAKVDPFITALINAGAKVHIAATYRPVERAFLMHYAWMIGHAGMDPVAVPAMKGLDIEWVHPDIAASKAAALAMVQGYGMAYVAALVSRHTQRRAIDMSISWENELVIKDAAGKDHTITSLPRTGMNPDLWTVGASFGVIKLRTDPPHWSDDGH